ncbi:MAG: AraC family transcriptional regulator [Cytophagales bacterium]|nr:AraC family transcriptional regulator [Cytophagales bacterium]
MKTINEYFDVPNSDSSLRTNIVSLGHNIHPPNKPYPNTEHPDEYYFNWEKGRSLNEYQIIYVSRGKGYFECHGNPIQLIEKGTIMLIYPNVWHRYRPILSTGWEEYWVGFKGDYADYLFSKRCFSSENPLIKIGFDNEFLYTFSHLIKTVEENTESFHKESFFHLIHLLGIIHASALLKEKNLSLSEEILLKMKNDIHLKWNEKINFFKLSEKYKVSYSWFRKSFKKAYETSPNQYQIMLKIRNATKMIQETNLTISEVANACGFQSEYYFSRIFKQKMNYTPSYLRKGK